MPRNIKIRMLKTQDKLSVTKCSDIVPVGEPWFKGQQIFQQKSLWIIPLKSILIQDEIREGDKP